jgi:ATP-dependent Lon protease
LDENFFDKIDIHLHIPSGAQPKDGPSAGVTIATALASLLLNRTIKPDLAMTGEITLRGQVLPVGGIKEKVLAAHRYELSTVILPSQNQFDLEDIPEEIRNTMKFIFVDTVDDVFQHAFDLQPAAEVATT